jgi:hypothetical protein
MNKYQVIFATGFVDANTYVDCRDRQFWARDVGDAWNQAIRYQAENWTILRKHEIVRINRSK